MMKVVEVVKQRKETLEDICLHEAGHAAMAFEFGVPIRYIQVECDPATGDMGGITNFEFNLFGSKQTLFEIWKKDRNAFFKRGADYIFDLHMNRIFTVIGGIAVNQRIRGIKDPGRMPYRPGPGVCISAGTIDDTDLLEVMMPNLVNEENPFRHARAINAMRGAITDVHHIMDNPHVWKGMQALVKALLDGKMLTGEQARKIYFDARGPIPPVSGSSLKWCKRRLRKAFPRIDSADLISGINAKANDKPAGGETA